MMHRAEISLLVLLASLWSSSAYTAAPDCLDTPAALDFWQPVREQAATTELPADDLARDLLACLGSPEPELRDGIGYELYAYWLRNGKLSDETRGFLLDELGERMSNHSPEAVLSRSFSALILAELMRSDAIEAFMDAAERQSLLDSAAAAIMNEGDFRGLDEDLGWVHPVAHMADLLWRFALHPSTTPDQGREILRAVRHKVAPITAAYAFNEPDRLARAISTLVARELVPADEIAAWIESFATPASMEKWSDAFRTPAGMTELHNTKLFLRALSDQLDGEDVDAGISAAIASLVQGFTQLV
jgi:predicted transcriptional regulator